MRERPTDNLLADLTDAQREAVTHFEGPLLILAGAGSGKTRVITRRVAWLLREGVRPGNILAITFTNKAAGEMKQRVEAIVPGSRVWISTFHSLGARLLRQYADRLGLDKNFTIYDQSDRARMVKTALEDAGIDNQRFTPDAVAGAISKAKNQLLSPERYAAQAKDFFGQTVARVYPVYEKRMRDANAFDFDDLLYWPALALKNDPELRGELDARFRFVLIDEYQDTNQAQYAIARGLSIDQPNLCVVGDPDQCLPPGTLVETPSGPRPVETLREGDAVLAATGHGAVATFSIEKVMVTPFEGDLLDVRVEGGRGFRATPNHRCFARFSTALAYLCRDLLRGARQAASDPIARTPVPPEATATAPGGDDVLWMLDSALPDDQRVRVALSDGGSLFACVPADYLRAGMVVPVWDGGRVVEQPIQSVHPTPYRGPVYDLSVPEVHNFIAGGVVVHNSIYKFRGSDIRNILDFERDFPGARVLTLGKNYRSTKSILAAAGGLIEHNKQRKPKELFTDNPAGAPVTVLTFETGVDEAEGVVKRIREEVRAGRRSYRDFAIFLRINALSRGLETAFVRQRVPFQIVKGLAFFERKENKDVLAYLRLLLNPRDDLSFLRVVNEPARGIGKVSLEHLRQYAEKNEIGLLGAAAQVERIPLLKGKAAKALAEFARMIHDLTQLRDAQPDELIRQVLEKSGYRQALKDSRDEEDEERLANIEELITAARQFAAEDNARTIGDFLENITLASDQDGWDERQDSVSVMTMHAAKGLEFPVVYLLAVEQGLLPHERSLGREDEVEEERRLAFVGMTRAKEELYLCHARLREFRGATLYAVPSMFLEELPPEPVRWTDLSASAAGTAAAMEAWRGGGEAARQGWSEAGIRPRPEPVKPRPPEGAYAEGMLVRHANYGVGRIVEVSGHGAMRKVKIRFPVGERTFIADKVTLEIVRKA